MCTLTFNFLMDIPLISQHQLCPGIILLKIKYVQCMIYDYILCYV